MDLSAAIITEHAVARMGKRDIEAAAVRQILAAPETVEPVRPGRVVAQGMIGIQLLRIFVDVDRWPPEVVTAYRTSKVGKDRRTP
jgi:hypothetical protein